MSPKERLQIWRKENPSKVLEQNKRSYLRNRLKIVEAARRYRAESSDHKIANAKWYKTHKDASLAKSKAWVKANPKRKYVHNSLRQNRISDTMRNWLSDEQRAEVIKIYENCPVGYHVDHIYPIKAKIFSGLHVPWNLQYLPAEENLRKNNKFNTY